MNATRNSRGNKHLVYAFMEAYRQRGSVEYSDDKLRTELTENFNSTKEGVTINSVINPPVVIKAMVSLPVPGRCFQCLANKDHVIESDSEQHYQYNYITAYHATGVIHALGIIQQGYGAGTKQRLRRNGIHFRQGTHGHWCFLQGLHVPERYVFIPLVLYG